MQVGIMAGPWSGAQLTVRYENFMLDYTTGSALRISSSGNNVTVSWPPIPSAILQSTTNLVPPVIWTPVGGTPTLDGDGYSLTIPAAANQFFRLVQ
jgi:hypothetical protein